VPDAGGGDQLIDGGLVPPTDDADAPAVMPHALLAITPNHGPFSGGTRVGLRGNGFAGNVRVWFGDNEVPRSDLVAVDEHRLQVTSPPGDAGAVDVVTQNGDDDSTRAVLPSGFQYDAFALNPATGPTSGGTLVTLSGQGTAWDETTTVSIDRNPCEIVSVSSPSELTCRAPAGTQGTKTVSVSTAGETIDLFDGYTYSDTDNGYRGGFSGDPLAGQLRVMVFDSVLGEAIPGASVIIGADSPKVARTDANGTVTLDVSDTAPTVTIARKCFQPITFAQAPSSVITAYLDPVLSVACFDPKGDLEPGGGTPGKRSSISGELVWPETQEFRRDNWSSVPQPQGPDEARVAYVFPLATRPDQAFSLPSAILAVTPDSAGTTGYDFSLSTAPGTLTLYALAGIENRTRSPAQFTAYAMGLTRGVVAPADTQTSDVFIQVDALLDHSFTIDLEPPDRTRRGPDRVQAALAIRVGNEGYALLPQGLQQQMLGTTQSFSFVGVPALAGSLSGTEYVAAVTAVSGASGGLPVSELALLRAPAGMESLLAGPFVQIPVLGTPTPNGLWNGQDLAWSSAAGGLAADLALIDITSESGLHNWRVVAPGAMQTTRLPDLQAIDPDLGWERGEQSFTLTLAAISSFNYGALRYRDLQQAGWAAHASDVASAAY
jgi:hypothetical protein